LSFIIDAPEVDEAVRADEAPGVYVERIARSKAAVVAGRHPGLPVLAADTSVVVDQEVLGKPESDAHARAMLEQLSGRDHRVLTGIAVDGGSRAFVLVETVVTFRPLTPAEINWYVSTGEGKDKAGGYASQARAASFILSMQGSATNVIGLPLSEALGLLSQAGVAMPWAGVAD
jgi:septum formation protein